MSEWPPDWPHCPVCGDYALDGHITCGRAECNESEQRRKREGSKGLLERFAEHERLMREFVARALREDGERG